MSDEFGQMTSLCMELVRAESETTVKQILEERDLWEYGTHWRPYGAQWNNWANAGNQQRRAFDALSEKLTNSIDAKLLRAVEADGADPEGADAPQSVQEAVERYFDVPKGGISDLSAQERRELAEHISLSASAPDGRRTPCNYTIVDDGVGQHPGDFEETFLTLGGENKISVPFVQGKFSQGSTGVHRFCGDHGTQLIVSRRAPDVTDRHRKWGFTVVRVFKPSKVTGQKLGTKVLMYLTVDGEIPRFNADSLPLRPTEQSAPDTYAAPMRHGTLVKLYEYNAPTTTTLKQDPSDRLATRLPDLPLPVRLYETRDYTAANNRQTLAGVTTRLSDRAGNVADGFPATFEIGIGGSEISGRIYAVASDSDIKNFRPKSDDGVIFTQNGQTHGSYDKQFFGRNAVGLDFLVDDLIVVVSCDGLTPDHRSELFMADRERLADDSDIASRLKDELETVIGDHDGIEQLEQRRRKEQLQNDLDENGAVKQAIERVAQDAGLDSVLGAGDVSQQTSGPDEPPKRDPDFGETFPTYFELEKSRVTAECGEEVNVRFNTDAENQYFERMDRPGSVELASERSLPDRCMTMWDGTATLRFSPEENPGPPSPGQTRTYTITVDDDGPRDDTPFKNTVTIEFVEKTEGDEDDQGGLSIPTVTEVFEEEWDEYNFDRRSAVTVQWGGGEYHFFVNMDSESLQDEIANERKGAVERLQEQFKSAVLLIGLGQLNEAGERYGVENGQVKDPDDETDPTATELVESGTRGAAPMLIPLLDNADKFEEGL